MDREVEELNNVLKEKAEHVYSLLSDFGKQICFPSKGILSQTAEAKDTEINATIGQAFEDDGTPMVLDALAKKINLTKHVFLYSSSYGQKELRKLWKKSILEKNPSLKTMSLPVVTNGLTHGLFVVKKLFIEEVEKVIMPDRFWENYKIVFGKENFDFYTLFNGNSFNILALREKLSGNGKKILLLNFPNNPTGYTPTEREVEQIIQAIKESAEQGNNILAICDDAYFGLVFEDGVYKESIFSKLADLHERVLAIKVDGITKEMYAWGLRVGFVSYAFKGMDEEVAEVLENKTAGTIRGTISNACTLSQLIAVDALKSPEFLNQKEEKYFKLKERYEIVKKVLNKNPKYKEFFEPLPFNSGYFMCVELKRNDAEEIRQKLIKQFNTGVIAIGKMLRIAYSSVSKEKIPQLFENIYKACK